MWGTDGCAGTHQAYCFAIDGLTNLEYRAHYAEKPALWQQNALTIDWKLRKIADLEDPAKPVTVD